MSDSNLLSKKTSTRVVTFTIKIDGKAISQLFGILSIVVFKEINKVPTANIVIQDGSVAKEDFKISNDSVFIPGNEIEILSGYNTEELTIFKGIIIKHGIKIKGKGASMLSIECKDKSVKLTVGAKNKYFVDLKDSEAIEEIIDTYGLDREIETTSVRNKNLVQFGSTDWDFMIARVEANGKVCIVDDGKIMVKAPSLKGDPVLNLLYGGNIMDFDAVMDARDQYQAIKAYAWDPANQSIVETDGVDPGINGSGNIPPSDLAAVIGLEHLELRHSGSLPQEELQAWANGEFLKKRLAKIRGRVGFRGGPDIKPGDLIALEGLGKRMNGKVYVSGIRHEISNGTWKTDAQFGLSPEWFTQTYAVTQLPASGILPAINGLQIGIVTQLKGDPESEDRIQVRLPIISNDEQGIWARVACLDAGKNRGTFFRPEVDDEVVVGFLNNDPRNAIVLGGLNSSKMPSPMPATDENNEKGYISRSEMKMIFDDKKKSFTLQTPVGKMIVIDEDAKLMKLKDEHGNEIVMNSNGISIESRKAVKIKAGTDFKVEAMKIDAKASASTELNSSGIMTIKGSLVQIN